MSPTLSNSVTFIEYSRTGRPDRIQYMPFPGISKMHAFRSTRGENHVHGALTSAMLDRHAKRYRKRWHSKIDKRDDKRAAPPPSPLPESFTEKEIALSVEQSLTELPYLFEMQLTISDDAEPRSGSSGMVTSRSGSSGVGGIPSRLGSSGLAASRPGSSGMGGTSSQPGSLGLAASRSESSEMAKLRPALQRRSARRPIAKPLRFRDDPNPVPRIPRRPKCHSKKMAK